MNHTLIAALLLVSLTFAAPATADAPPAETEGAAQCSVITPTSSFPFVIIDETCLPIGIMPPGDV